MHAASLASASRVLANLGWLFATLILFALLGGPKYPEDPRYVGVDWRSTHNKLRLYVFSKVKETLSADDIAQTVIRRALEPTARPWDREKQSIVDYLGSLANTEITNLRKSFWNKRVTGELTPELLETRGSFGADAESRHRTMTDELRHDRLFAALIGRLDGHKLPLLLLSVYDRGSTHPSESTEVAEAAGHTANDIANARQRIHRELAKLLHEEAEDAATALRIAAR